MASLDSSLAFFGIALLLALAPGPDNLFVLMQSAVYGRRSGVLVVLGLCTGLLGHTSAVAFGLSALFAASTAAFRLVQLVGGGYLLYLAWEAFRAPVLQDDPSHHGTQPRGRLYRRGIVMNLTNPKVALFFLAFLPQFVDVRRGSVASQVFWFGFLFVVATLIVFLAVAQLAGFLGERLRRSQRAQRLLNRSAALVFVALALRLLTSDH